MPEQIRIILKITIIITLITQKFKIFTLLKCKYKEKKMCYESEDLSNQRFSSHRRPPVMFPMEI